MNKKQTRREWLRWSSALLTGSAFSKISLTHAQEKPPNFVWIIADDFSPDLGCYGYPTVHTPNLDQLAAEGIRYEHAYTPAAVCSPSRSAWITGMYQTSIGAHNHRTWNKKELPNGIKPFTHYLQEAGYLTVNVKGLGANAKRDFNFIADHIFDSNDPEDLLSNKPFFAYVNFHEPHRTFVQKEDGIDPDKVELPPYYPDHPVARKDWAAYLDTVEVLDKKVGNFLQWLEENNLADNTVVMFIGDHGRPHVRGKQWLYDSGIRVPLIVRWPEKIKPNQVSQEMVSSIDLAATILNIAGIQVPETMEGQVFLGPNKQKRDVIFAARDRCDEAFDRIRCVRDQRFKYIRNDYPEIPYWQTSRYKDKYYPMLKLMKKLYNEGKLNEVQKRFFEDRKPREELYDTQNDPYEIHNLAENPEYNDKLEEMRSRLDQWIDETGDQGQTPEPKENWELIWEGRERKYPNFEPDEWDKRFKKIREALEKRNFQPESEWEG